MYFVYILECQGGKLYTGITTDVKRRLTEHQEGMGGHFTRAFKPLRVAYTEKHDNRSEALKREAAIKKFSRPQKVALFS